MPLSKKFIKSRQAYQVTFEISKEAVPSEKEIRLLGDFNAWKWDEAPVLKFAKGSYKTTVELPAGNALQFRYKSANGNWYNDHSADDYVQAPFNNVDNCLVYLPEVKEEAPKPKKAAAKTASKPTAKASKVVAKKPAAKKTVAKAAPKKAAKAVAVNFTKIEGIGPKIAGLIMDAKITTYEGLAATKKKDLQTILDNAGKRYAMHDPSTWAKQSKLLAQGKLKELKTLQDQLKGGKKK